MWDKIKALFRSILENGIFELVKALVLLIIIPTAGGLGTSILADFITVLQPYRIPLITLVVFAILFVVLCIYQRFSKKYPAFPPVNSGYSIMQREVSFQYGKTECSYEMKVRLRAKKDGINQYVGKYAWSGSARPTIKCIKSQHTYIELDSVYRRLSQDSAPDGNTANLHSSKKRCCIFGIAGSNPPPVF